MKGITHGPQSLTFMHVSNPWRTVTDQICTTRRASRLHSWRLDGWVVIETTTLSKRWAHCPKWVRSYQHLTMLNYWFAAVFDFQDSSFIDFLPWVWEILSPIKVSHCFQICPVKRHFIFLTRHLSWNCPSRWVQSRTRLMSMWTVNEPLVMTSLLVGVPVPSVCQTLPPFIAEFPAQGVS